MDAEGCGFPSFRGVRSTPPRTRTQRSGSRPKRRSKGASEAFATRRKRSLADFATTQSPGQGHTPNSGCGRVFYFSVILAQRGSPGEGRRGT